MSLITFRSKNQGSVIMFPADAMKLLALLDLPGTGTLLPDQLSALMAQLGSEHHEEPPQVIHFAQRATPVLQLMARCLKASETIHW
jgi:hypothetical protein